MTVADVGLLEYMIFMGIGAVLGTALGKRAWRFIVWEMDE